MSAETACWSIAAALLLVGLLLLAAGLCRAAGMASRAEEARGRVWDEKRGWIRLPYGTKPGPGQITEAEVADRDRFQVLVSDLTTDPQWAAGPERLFDAVRDHHTNTPEGD